MKHGFNMDTLVTKKFLALVLMVVLCFGCTNNTSSNPDVLDYLSVTVTKEYDSNQISGLETSVFALNFKDGEYIGNELMYSFPYSAQYPLALYDKSRDSVFYTSRDVSGMGDQIFQYNVKDKTTKQLTYSLFGANYIVPLNDKEIFIVAAPLDAELVTLQPYVYNFDKEQLIQIQWDYDLSIKKIFALDNSGAIYMSVQSQRQMRELMEMEVEYGGINESLQADTHIFKYENHQFTHVIEIEQFLLNNFVIIDDHLYFDNELFPMVGCRNIQTKEKCEWIDINLTYGQYDTGTNSVFSIRNGSIHRLNLDSKESNDIFKNPFQEGKSAINNQWMIYKKEGKQ